MTKSALTLCFLCFSLQLFSQTVWNKKLPFIFNTPSAANGYATAHGEHFLVAASGLFAEIDLHGTIVGKVEEASFGNSFVLSNFLQRRVNPGTNKPFFLAGWRRYPSQPYTLTYYMPDNGGWRTSLSFGGGEFGLLQTKCPVTVVFNDTTLLVFSRSMVRKVACPRDTLWLEWEKGITIQQQSFPTAAVVHNDLTFFVTSSGQISAIDQQGNQILTRSYPTNHFKGIIKTNDGFLICGTGANDRAILLKTDFNATLVWEKAFVEDTGFNALAATLDGNFVVTGESVDGNILLLKVTNDGTTVYRKTFQPGFGITVLATQDGGVFLTAGSNNNQPSNKRGYFGIKTNESGETTVLDDRVQFKERNLNNGGFSLTHAPSQTLFSSNGRSALEIPAESGTTTLFAHSPWLAGKGQNGDLHISAALYGGQNQEDYAMGLVSDSGVDFDRVWLVNRAEINSVRRDFATDGVLDAPPPFDLLTWPAKGNPHFKYNLDFSSTSTALDELPAPFVDFNQDGIYNVFDGDYPLLKGDRMLWFAFHDATQHVLSGGTPLECDFFVSVYAYDCPQNNRVLQTVFADYQIVNRSNKTYSDVRCGFYTDFDLGCNNDDYVGTLTDANSVYAYNMDAVDGMPGASCAAGVVSYNEQIPVQSLTLLNHSLDHSIYTHEDSFFPTASPGYFANLIRSIWPDGTPLTVGGNGINPSSTAFTNHIFPDNPADPQGWSMCTENFALGDIRGVSSHGPFNFAAGDTFNMQLAFIFHPDIPHPCPDIVGVVRPTILQIQQWHDDGTLNDPLDLGSVQTIQPGQSLTLNASVNNALAYQWSTGANSPGITVTQPGEYSVSVTRASGCESVETVLVKSASNTSAPTATPNWQLFPNPAQDMLNIVVEHNGRPATILLRNALGQTVASTTESNGTLGISVAQLPTGIYWAELWQNGQFGGSRKVVVAR